MRTEKNKEEIILPFMSNKECEFNPPPITVITPCLNSEKCIEQTIQSVINQTYRNIEYIIVDGGSTDKTLDIIRKYEGRIARWISEPDKGVYDAVNKGIALSSGELIGILSSNDRYDKDAVRWIAEAFKQNKDAVIFFGKSFQAGKDNVILEESREPAHRIKPFQSCLGIDHQSVFARRDLYKRWRYDLKFKIGADYDLLWKAYAAGTTFCYVDKIINYRSPSGLSGGYRCLLEHYAIRKKYSKAKALYIFFVETICYLGERLKLERFFGSVLTGQIKRLSRYIHRRIKTVFNFGE